MASIRRRGEGQYQARVRNLGHADTVKTFPTRKDAQLWAAGVESDQRRGIAADYSKAQQQLTLGDAFRRYLAEVTPHKKSASQERRRIAAWQKNPLAHRFLITLRSSDMAGYRDARLRQGMSGDTVRLELAVVSHVFEIALKEWGMEGLSNPVRAIRKPKVSRGRDRRLTADEETRLLDHCTARGMHWLREAIRLAVATGMRRGELVGLKWVDVDLQARVAYLADTKNGEARVVPLSSVAMGALWALRVTGGERVLGMHPDVLTYQFAQACRAVGIAGLRFNDLRHEATSRFFEMKLNMMEVAAITGHKTLQMLKRYTHLKAVDLVARLG